MHEANLDEFTDLLTTLCLLYKTPVNEKLIELYWDALERFEWRAVKTAFQAHLVDPDAGQFIMTPLL